MGRIKRARYALEKQPVIGKLTIEQQPPKPKHKESMIRLDDGRTVKIKKLKNRKIITARNFKVSKLLVPKGSDKSIKGLKTSDELERAKLKSRYENARKIHSAPIKSSEEEKERNAYLDFTSKLEKKHKTWTRNPPAIKEKKPDKETPWQELYWAIRKVKLAEKDNE